MSLYSTKNHAHTASWREAVLRGLAPDGGLYMPSHIPKVPAEQLHKLQELSFSEFAGHIAAHYLEPEIPSDILQTIATTSFDFPLTLKQLDDTLYILELFHGPTCAFKDFGARFMSETFRYFLDSEKLPLTVLTATSGDTGSAVASAFLDTQPNPPIRVAILYPKDRVSTIQRRQMTTLGHNITAYEVEGSFDDCQALVKRALADPSLGEHIRLTSANSINIARLLPQIFYYAYASLRFSDQIPPVFVVPSGNLGNLVGSLFARVMGFPIAHSVAACNQNKTFVDFINTNEFSPAQSLETISNAMDVGNPSNIHRVIELLSKLPSQPTQPLSAFSVTDEETTTAMRNLFERFDYSADPHTAVAAHLVMAKRIPTFCQKNPTVVVSTAHPAKFGATVRAALGIGVTLPPQLEHVHTAKEHRHPLPHSYDALCRALLD